MSKYYSVLGLILCLISPDVEAQYQNLKFESYSTIEGLSSSTCTDIFQDSKGFMWFGTIDGLNKFDGYQFTIYRPEYGKSNSLGGNRITSIVEDDFQNLWIGTSTGLNRFDQKTEIFHQVVLSDNSEESSLVPINCLVYDHQTLWVGTVTGLVKIDLSGGVDQFTTEHYNSSPRSKYQLDQEEVVGIIPVDSGVIVGTTGSSLNIINTRTAQISQIPGGRKADFEINQLPKSFLLDQQGVLLYGNDLSRMSWFDFKTGTYTFKDYTNGKAVPVFDIYQDKQGVIWIASDGDGIFLLDRERTLTQQIVHDPQDPSSLPNNQPSKVIEDNEGMFWVATYNEGVCKLSLNKSAFAHVFYRPGRNDGLSSRIAQAVLEDQQGRIWVGTDGGGLNLLNQQLEVKDYFRHQENKSTTISSDKIVYMEEGLSGKLWICTWDGGLNLFDPETGRVKRFTYNPNDPYSIAQNSVWYATQANNGILWCGTLSAGLNAYNPQEDRFYRYNSQTTGGQLLSDLVFSLLLDSKNRLLIGTDAGLQALDLSKISSLQMDALPLIDARKSQLRGFRINHMIETSHQSYWIATDLGLYHLDGDFNLIKRYTTSEGLPSNLVVGVALDNDGSIWATTKSGLSRLDIKSEDFKNFNIHDGIQGMEFQSKSIFHMSDGRLLVGGINGLNAFRPEDVHLPQEFSTPRITSMSVLNQKIRVGDLFNERVLLDQLINNDTRITLNYDEGFVSLDYVSLHLPNPDRVSYAHRMIGVNEDWVYVKDIRTASYSNLTTGDYRFEVKSALDDDWENAKLASVALKVLPPPWRTWWAYLIYFVLVGGLTWLIFRIYSQRLQEERIHELDQMKLRFFINVSHEFRTPLTLILNPVDKILSSYNDAEVVKESALVIQRSARKLLSLMTQLLDFRKMDLGKTPLELVEGDLVKFCKDTFLLFEDLAKSKALNFKYESSPESIKASFDPDKVEKIITNLLSNAIKFTDPDGTVAMSVKKHTHGNKEYVRIVVSDTGIGFKKEQLKEVFSRFFHVDSTKTGTGIGLNFTKGLVEIHKGEISVESEYKEGSTFTVELPLDKEVYKGARHTTLDEGYVLDPAAVLSTAYEVAISDHKLIEEEPDSVDSKSPTVLIVEDNKELRVHLRKELKSGFKVREAANGREGLEKINKYYPDIVISDVMMPEMDGFELCRNAKMNLETCHIPVILLTARSLEEDRIEGYETGADEYLPKPFNVSVLKARINNLLEAKRRLREKFTSVGGMLPSSEITTNTLDEAFLDKATKVILDHVSDQDFRLAELLKEMGVSRSQFYRKVSSLTGQNPSHFIRVIRLKYALDLLRRQEHSVKEIAYMSGFNSSAYFTKTFREHFGKAPNQYLSDGIE